MKTLLCRTDLEQWVLSKELLAFWKQILLRFFKHCKELKLGKNAVLQKFATSLMLKWFNISTSDFFQACPVSESCVFCAHKLYVDCVCM